MYGVHSITCTKCLGVIQIPMTIPSTAYCECGMTYFAVDVQSVGWGGPGNPRTNEPDTFPDEQPAKASKS